MGKNRLSQQKFSGFALIELMVVVAILSITAAILVPRFLKHQIQKRQDGCHQSLQSLFIAEKNYFQKNGKFTQKFEDLGWSPPPKGRYQYLFLPTPSPRNGFVFECQGNIDRDPTLDIATIDETGRITQISNDVRQ